MGVVSIDTDFENISVFYRFIYLVATVLGSGSVAKCHVVSQIYIISP